jgi:hypothetical protein
MGLVVNSRSGCMNHGHVLRFETKTAQLKVENKAWTTFMFNHVRRCVPGIKVFLVLSPLVLAAAAAAELEPSTL